MHPDIEWAIARNAQTADERGEPLPPAADAGSRPGNPTNPGGTRPGGPGGSAPPPSRKAAANAFEALAAIGENHGRPLLAAPLSEAQADALCRAARALSGVLPRAQLGPRPKSLALALHRRQLGIAVFAHGEIMAFQINNAGRKEAARLTDAQAGG